MHPCASYYIRSAYLKHYVSKQTNRIQRVGLLYYDKDNTIELTVPIPAPAPGFDIVYILSEPEKEAYVKTGIKALESRIADMGSNYTAYTMYPWR